MAGARSNMRIRTLASMRSISPSSPSMARNRAWASLSTRASSISPKPAEDRRRWPRRRGLGEDGMKALLAAAVALLAVAAAARAESVEDFYRGKQLQVLVGAEVGGGY